MVDLPYSLGARKTTSYNTLGLDIYTAMATVSLVMTFNDNCPLFGKQFFTLFEIV